MKGIKNRIRWALLIFVALMVVPICALFYIQIIRGNELRQMAVEQQTSKFVVAARRGTIYDRNGRALVKSITVYDVSVDPNTVKNAQEKYDKDKKETDPEINMAEEIAKLLHTVLGVDAAMVEEKLKKESNYELIAKNVSTEQHDAIVDGLKVEGKSLSGVGLKENSKREYVYSNLASNLIGFTGADNQGLAGIEALYDTRLSGVDGMVLSATSGQKDRKLHYEYEQEEPAIPGDGIVLTIDEGVQAILENILKEKTALYGCEEGGCAIAVDPKTGEILGLACCPDYDLTNPMAEVTDPETLALLEAATVPDTATEQEKKEAAQKRNEILNSYYYNKRWANRVFDATYEPGSVFKMVTAAIGLEERIITLNDTFSCNSGRTVDGVHISCWSTGDKHGVQNVAKGLQNSCNSVFMDIGARIGKDTFKQYLSAFGFGRVTNVGFASEAAGLLYENYSNVDLAVCSFGQSNTVTPLQMVMAASAVVNGGYLMEPHFVKAFTDQDGVLTETVEPKIVRQVISESTSTLMRELLEGVVSYGTGKNAKVAGYRVGGKTGTSEKLPREENKKIASFCGFMPADDPQIVVLLLLDEPTPGVGGSHTAQGGQIAAPTVGAMLQEIGEYMNIPKDTSKAGSLTVKEVPNVIGMDIEAARAMMINNGFEVKVLGVGSGALVETQIPPGGAMVSDGTTVVLCSGDVDTMVTVPEVVGYPLSDAKLMIENAGLNFRRADVGAGDTASARAHSQSPAAGETVPQGTVVTVEFIEYETH